MARAHRLVTVVGAGGIGKTRVAQAAARRLSDDHLEGVWLVAADERLDEWAVLDCLSALVDKSLVVADGADRPRYRLLESARAFALEKLNAIKIRVSLRLIDDIAVLYPLQVRQPLKRCK